MKEDAYGRRESWLQMNKKRLFAIGAAAVIVLGVLFAERFVFNKEGRIYETYEETWLLDGSDDRISIRMEEFTSELDEKTAEELRYQDEINRLYYELLGAEYESALEDTLTVIDGKTYKTVKQAVISVPLGEARYIDQLQFSYPVDESRYSNYGVEARFYLDGVQQNADHTKHYTWIRGGVPSALASF